MQAARASVRGLSALAAFAVASCSPASDVPAGNASTLPLVPYFRELKSTPVTVDGQEFRFLVDTGGGRTAVSPELAARIGCRPDGRDVGYRMTGEAVAFQLCDSLAAAASGHAIRLEPVAVLDVNSLLPPELPRLDGILALDAFRGHAIGIDWKGGELTVRTSPSRPSAEDGAVPLRFATGENGAALTVLLPVQGVGRRLWFLLDSGNIQGTLIGRHVAQEGRVALSADGNAELAVGGRPAVKLPVVVGDINYDGVLGTEYLLTAPVMLDLRSAPGSGAAR